MRAWSAASCASYPNTLGVQWSYHGYRRGSRLCWSPHGWWIPCGASHPEEVVSPAHPSYVQGFPAEGYSSCRWACRKNAALQCQLHCKTRTVSCMCLWSVTRGVLRIWTSFFVLWPSAFLPSCSMFVYTLTYFDQKKQEGRVKESIRSSKLACLILFWAWKKRPHSLKVYTLCIPQVRWKCGLIEKDNYNINNEILFDEEEFDGLLMKRISLEERNHMILAGRLDEELSIMTEMVMK